MEMKYKVANYIRITKIHSQSNARIFKSLAVVVRNVDSVAKKRLVHSRAAVIEQQEVQLVNMERMKFAGPVFDDPILHRSLLRDNVWDPGFRIELCWRLALDSYVKFCCTRWIIRIEKSLGEVKPPCARGSHAPKPWRLQNGKRLRRSGKLRGWFRSILRNRNLGERAIGIVFTARSGIHGLCDEKSRAALRRRLHDKFRPGPWRQTEMSLPIHKISRQAVFV